VVMISLAFYTLITVVGANWGKSHHGGCPYLAKVVPQGATYLHDATEFTTIPKCSKMKNQDCCSATLVQQFEEQIAFTKFSEQARSRDETKLLCSALEGNSLISIFPSFSTRDMVFEVDTTPEIKHNKQYVLVDLQFSSESSLRGQKQLIKTGAILDLISPKPEFTTKAVFDQMQMGSRFLKQVFEHYDCDVYEELLEIDAVVRHHGNPSRLTHGKEVTFDNPRLGQEACKEIVDKDKRFHTSNNVVINRYYYDKFQSVLYISAERHYSVIFSPGVKKIQPLMMVLHFSAAGKIKEVRSYETEVLHILQKWGAKYGQTAPPPLKPDTTALQPQPATSTNQPESIGVVPPDGMSFRLRPKSDPRLAIKASGHKRGAQVLAINDASDDTKWLAIDRQGDLFRLALHGHPDWSINHAVRTKTPGDVSFPTLHASPMQMYDDKWINSHFRAKECEGKYCRLEPSHAPGWFLAVEDGRIWLRGDQDRGSNSLWAFEHEQDMSTEKPLALAKQVTSKVSAMADMLSSVSGATSVVSSCWIHLLIVVLSAAILG